MSASDISFFTEDIEFSLKQKTDLRKWINSIIKSQGKRTGELNFIFCSDSYLLDINRQYLNHNTFTDIITFDNSEDQSRVEGDIFISVDRIRENALNFKVAERDELHRVIIHGVLHLLGYKDKKPNDKKQMTLKEDEALALRTF